MKLRQFIPLLFIVLPLASCAPPAPDVNAVRKTIDEFNAATTDAMLNGTIEKAAAFYAEDALSMPPNESPIKGKEAITDWMTAMSKSGVKITAVKFTTDNVEAGGKVAYETGSYEMSMEIPGMGKVDDTGNYVSIWKQQQDGSWKVQAESWNSRKPLPGPEASNDKKK